MLCDVIFGGHGRVYICLKYLGTWECEKTCDLYCKNDLCVTCDWRAETSYTFEWQSIVRALLKNSLYTCSFQFRGATIVVVKLWGCPRLCEGFSVQLMEIDFWYPPADPWSTDRI